MGRNWLYFLKRIDYFGVQQTLRVNSFYKYTSRFGGFIFLMYLIFGLGYFFYSFKSYTNKEKKNVIMSEHVVVPAPDFNMKKLNFTVAFALAFDNNTLAFDALSQYLEFGLNHVIIEKGIKTKKTVKVRPCSYEDFPIIEKESVDILQLTSNQCMNETDYVIGGLYTDDIFRYLEYTISFKKNILKNITNLEYMKRVFTDSPLKINFVFVDIALDVNNLVNPSRLYVNSLTNYLNFNSFQKQNLDFTLLNFVDDASIILEQPFIKNFVKFYSQFNYFYTFENRTNTANEDRDRISRLYIRSNQHVKTIKREFQKLPSYIADVSGIVSNILVVIYVVITFINEFKLKQSLINKVFNFKDHIIQKEKIMEKINDIMRLSQEDDISLGYKHKNNSSHSQNIKKTHQEETELVVKETNVVNTNPDNNQGINFSYSQFINKIVEQKNNSKSSTDKTIIVLNKKGLVKTTVDRPDFLKTNKIKNKFSYKHALNSNKFVKSEELISTKKPLDFNFCEMIYSLFCCSPNHLKYRKEIYKKGREKVHYYLDVLTLVKKFQEFDIVKSLIFSKEQLTILNFLSKPIVSVFPNKKSTNKNKIKNSFETKDFSNMVLRDSQINEDEVENLYQSYYSLKKSKNLNEIDQKLMNRLEKKISNIIE